MTGRSLSRVTVDHRTCSDPSAWRRRDQVTRAELGGFSILQCRETALPWCATTRVLFSEWKVRAAPSARAARPSSAGSTACPGSPGAVNTNHCIARKTDQVFVKPEFLLGVNFNHLVTNNWDKSMNLRKIIKQFLCCNKFLSSVPLSVETAVDNVNKY